MGIQHYIPYSWPRRVLFSLAPEASHYRSLQLVDQAYRLRMLGDPQPMPGRRLSFAGLNFENSVGLAAGLDKNATHIDSLGSLGFGSIEVGTVTPLPQPGNPAPRLFRLANKQAIINRMGFNNLGVEAMIPHLKKRQYSGILGVNIGKNKQTPANRAIDDYIYAMHKVFLYADYITANISSPNTQGLRDLQQEKNNSQFLEQLVSAHEHLQKKYAKHCPLFLKLAPDLTEAAITQLAHTILRVGINGVILTNTTIARDGVTDHLYGYETGGLSGAPLRQQSTQVLQSFRQLLGADYPIIGVGGIDSKLAADEKITAGANLVQIYTGFIYQGWDLIEQCAYC